MERSVINKILAAKYMYYMAKENVESEDKTKLLVGVILLQDAIELFMVAVSEYKNANVKINTKFHQYFDIINDKIHPKELPFKGRLISLNKFRVDAKHYGIQPPSSECKELLLVSKEFLENVSRVIFDKEFMLFSLLDLLEEGEVKTYLKTAEESYSNGRYDDVLIECRKAIFIQFEENYNISFFKDKEEVKGFALYTHGYKAPFWVKNRDYIDENVREPFDYIVIDHSQFDMDLIKDGIDTNMYWNVWRLTPRVFKYGKDNKWKVKYEFKLFDDEIIKQNAEYVLQSTIEMFVILNQNKTKIRSPFYGKYNIDIHGNSIPVYNKASITSEIIGYLPEKIDNIETDYNVTGLESDDLFWHVMYDDEEKQEYFYGFVEGKYISLDRES